MLRLRTLPGGYPVTLPLERGEVGAPDADSCGLEANRRNLDAAVDCVHRPGLIPGRCAVTGPFDDTTRSLEPLAGGA